MKKHLLAVAVAATLPSIAMAQVTVYGNIEMGPTSYDAGTTTTSYIANGIVNSSRLGFRGEEDLGGGLKAFFRLESGLNAETGTIGGANNATITGTGGTIATNNQNFFNRGAEIGLSGGFGTVKIGKFDLPSESVEISHFGNVGIAATSGIFDNDIERGSDISGAWSYKTPKMNGIDFEIAGTFEDQPDGTTKTTSNLDTEILSLGVTGTIGALEFKAATAEQKATTKNIRQYALSASYDFGMAKASLTRIVDDMGTAADKSLTIISAVMPLGNGLAAHGAYRMFSVDGQADDQKGYALGVSKSLSKRTTAYATYLGANATSTGTVIDTTQKPKQYYVGVNHAF
jgi:predicted porin